jgi:hypothetical protein
MQIQKAQNIEHPQSKENPQNKKRPMTGLLVAGGFIASATALYALVNSGKIFAPKPENLFNMENVVSVLKEGGFVIGSTLACATVGCFIGNFAGGGIARLMIPPEVFENYEGCGGPGMKYEIWGLAIGTIGSGVLGFAASLANRNLIHILLP